jgi:hypothetical protein
MTAKFLLKKTAQLLHKNPIFAIPKTAWNRKLNYFPELPLKP